MTSPTFNIIKEYTSGEMPLYHMDVYRLDGKVDDLGIEEYYKKVVFVLLSGLKLLLIIYLKIDWI